MKTAVSFPSLALFLSLVVSGCSESKAAAPPVASAPAQASVALAAAPLATVQTSRIVFVDKEHGCACTQKRVDGSWAALQSALAGKPTLPVERLHSDTQPEQVEPYNKLRAILALPALYFVDAKGGLVELLQGEVTTEQIQAVLGTGAAGR